MKLLTSKKDSTKVMILSLSDDDDEVIKVLWNEKVLFGAYELYTYDKEAIIPNEYLPFVKAYPNLKSIMKVNIVRGFVNDKHS